MKNHFDDDSNESSIKEMIGLKFTQVTSSGDELTFVAEDDRRFVFFHSKECSESVEIESIVGDLADLVGSPILVAEEVISKNATPAGLVEPSDHHNYTWTFYKFATRKGYVDIRWFGESNGYYSETVEMRIDLPMTIEIPSQVKADPQALAAPGEAQHMLDVALSYEIDSPEMLNAAADELRTILARKKFLNDKRMEITRPLDAAKQAVMSFFSAPLNLLQQAEDVLKSGMLSYEHQERERIAAEQRAAEARAAAERAEAERVAREADAAARAAQEIGDMDAMQEAAAKAEEAREQVELALTAPTMPAAAAPKAAGASFRGTWKGRLTDKAALIAAAASRPELQGLLDIDTTALNAMARAVKDSAKVPGVEFYEERNVASRGARA